MDAVDHPLDWWAYGGHAEVARQLGCAPAFARRAVRRAMAFYFRRTGDPIWKPIGNQGYARLRRVIMANQALDNELR